MSWRYEQTDWVKHRALEEKRRREGRRMWSITVLVVVVFAALGVALVKGFL